MHAGKLLEGRAQFGLKSLGRLARHRREIDLELTVVGPEGVLANLGAAGPLRHRLDAPVLLQRRGDRVADADGFIERRPWHRLHVHAKMALVELGEKTSAEEGHHRERNEDQSRGAEHDGRGMLLQGDEPLAIPPLEPPDDRWVVSMSVPVGEEHERQRRRDGQRHEQRRHDRHDVRDAQRTEECTLHARESDDRNEDQRDEEGGIHDARPYLDRGVIDDLPRGPARWQRSVLAQPPDDVLAVDDRVIHDFADRDGQSPQRQRVDGEAERIQDDDSGEEREGDGGERDEGRPEVRQEEHQHDRHQQAADEE